MFFVEQFLSAMRKRVSSLLLAMVCVAVFGGDALHKLSPFVLKAVMEKPRHAGNAMSMGKPRSICVFVRVEGDNAEEALAANGCRICDRAGDIFIVTMPLSNVGRLANESAVARIEANSPCSLTMDTTSTLIGATKAYAAEGLTQAYTGHGVMVGVMDVGFDLTHPNFYDATASHYRIKAFWDQLATDTIGSGLPVGRSFSTPTDVLEAQHSCDGLTQTHGTHTLGIAAGGGFGGKYRGIAWESDICTVSNAVSDDLPLIDSADVYKYTTATDALGFKYIFDQAERLGQPCVASFSEGYRMRLDGDDSLYCAYLSQLTGPGRIIVASAGNASRHATYIPKPVGVAEAGAFVVTPNDEAELLVVSNGEPELLLLHYGDSRTDTLRIATAMCPKDTTTAFALGTAMADTLLCVDVSRSQSAFPTGENVFTVSLSGKIPFSSFRPLAFAVVGGDVDASVSLLSSDAAFANGLVSSQWNGAEVSHNVLAPGCFPSIITVGSTIHRTGFTNYKGVYYDYSQSGRNDGVRSSYSSIGPGSSDMTKPDVMAPGDNVVSSYSSFYIEHNPTANDIKSDVEHFNFNGRTYAWNSNTGTSMAAPVVAGTIALWLQACPTLTPEKAMQVISSTARHPEEELPYPNNQYGYGEIDAYRGLLNLLGIDGIEEISHHQCQGVRVDVLPSGLLRLRLATPAPCGVKLAIYSLDGHKVANFTLCDNEKTEATVPLPELGGGVYAVQITSGSGLAMGSTLVRIDNNKH